MKNNFSKGPSFHEVEQALQHPEDSECTLDFTVKGATHPSHRFVIYGMSPANEGFDLIGQMILLGEPNVNLGDTKIWAMWRENGEFIWGRSVHAALQA